MRVFIQKVKGQFANVNFFSADEGFRELGYEIIYFEEPDTCRKSSFYCQGRSVSEKDVILFKQEDVVVGGVPVVTKMVRHWNPEYQHIDSYPEELRGFTRGNPTVKPIGWARKRVLEGYPVFVKPLDEDRKLFNGNLAKVYRDLTYTAMFPDNYKVWTADPVKIQTEYRVFVHRGVIKGCKHYRGDYFVALNPVTVSEAVARYEAAPVAYALDMGVDNNGDTFLIEVSDAMSLGMYGFYPPFYAAMIADRWNQLVGLPI